MPAEIEKLLANRAGVDEAVTLLARTNEVLVSGRGLAYAAAVETALKLEETCLRPVRGLSYADLKHGPIAIVDPQLVSIVVAAQDGPMLEGLTELLGDLRSRGALTVGIGGDSGFAAAADVSVAGPDLPEMVAPIALGGRRSAARRGPGPGARAQPRRTPRAPQGDPDRHLSPMRPARMWAIVPMSSNGICRSRAIWLFGPHGSFFKPVLRISPTVSRISGHASASATAGGMPHRDTELQDGTTPRTSRGTTLTGERTDRWGWAPRSSRSTACSQAELPKPTTSTGRPIHGSPFR